LTRGFYHDDFKLKVLEAKYRVVKNPPVTNQGQSQVLRQRFFKNATFNDRPDKQ
jgi:hypothetical protein